MSETLVLAYATVRPQYEAFTTSLDSLLRTLLTTSEIEYFAIEPRTKEVASFEGKVQREDKAGKYHEVADLTDLSGIRVIAYLQEDCDRVCTLLRKNFDIDESNSVRKEDELDPDKFGYLSTHYVVSLTPDRVSLPEFARFDGLKAEIQIRTLLQHTWASIDWKFRYKGEREAPKQIRRRLFRISALLEAADNEFSAVKMDIDNLRKVYAEEIAKGDLDIPLNSESAFSFVKTSDTAKAIFEAAKKSGLFIMQIPGPNAFYNGLVGTAEAAGITTLNQLDAKLKDLSPQIEEFFAYVIPKAAVTKSNPRPSLVETAVIRYPLVLTISAAKRKVIYSKHKFIPGYSAAIEDYIKSREAKLGSSKTVVRRRTSASPANRRKK